MRGARRGTLLALISCPPKGGFIFWMSPRGGGDVISTRLANGGEGENGLSETHPMYGVIICSGWHIPGAHRPDDNDEHGGLVSGESDDASDGSES